METDPKHIGFLSYYRLTYGPWQAFERAIARLLAHRGWESYDVVGGAWDRGADIIASIENQEKVFQVKFSENNQAISTDIVGDIKRAIEFYKIESGVCVSNRPLSVAQRRKFDTLINQGYTIALFTANQLLDAYEDLPTWVEEKREMRSYQFHSVERLVQSYKNNERKGLISLATGLGKTFVAARFLKWCYQEKPLTRVLILADKKDLILQFDKAIWTSLPKQAATHILHESEKPGFHDGIILSTFQSFTNYYEKHPDLYFDLIIVDEAHHAPADTYSEVIESLNPGYLLGLTATPFRSDDRSVTDLFGEPLVQYGVVKAMKHGYLSNVDYRIKNDNIDLDWIGRNSQKGYTIRQLNKNVFLPERDEKICETVMNYWKMKKPKRGIIFCNSSLHAERTARLLRSSFNIPVSSLTTRIKDPKERVKRLREFRKGEISMLTCYDMLNEGIDVPDVDFIVYLRVTHSRIIFLQQLGRGLRYLPGKTLFVLDFVADIRRLDDIRRFKWDFDYDTGVSTSKGKIEELELPSALALTFSDESTKDFLNLVHADQMELGEMELDDIIE